MALPQDPQRGTVLYELHDPTDKLIRAMPNVIAPTWTAALVDDGTFQFQLLRTDPLVDPATPAHLRVREDCVVHIYVDGTDVLQYVIEDVDEAYAESGADLITFTGRDVRAVLDRALIYPDGWVQPADGSDPRQVQYGGNILTNGDFETPPGNDTSLVPGWVVPSDANWTLGAVPGGIALTVAAGQGAEKTTTPATGVTTYGSALQAVVPTAIVQTTLAYQTGLFKFDRLAGEGGTQWRITAAARSANPDALTDGPTGEGVGLTVRIFDEQGRELEQILGAGMHATVPDVYNPLVTTFNVPPEAFSYRVELWAKGRGTFHWDLAKLQVIYVDALPVYPPQPIPGVTLGPQILRDPYLRWTPYTVGSTGPGSENSLFHGWYNPNGKILEDTGNLIPRDPAVDPDPTPWGGGYYTTEFVRLDFRSDPSGVGIVLFQDLPVEAGRGYGGGLVVGNDSVRNPDETYTLPTAGSGTFVWRQFLDQSRNPLGPRVATDGPMNTQHPFSIYPVDMAPLVAPEGAAYLRVELWAPAGAPNPCWGQVRIYRETISGADKDTGPGVVKAYQQRRLPEIIADLVDSTRARIDSELLTRGQWPVYPGHLEYNHEYDVVDGVLLTKDLIQAALFRFDPLGSAIRTLVVPDPVGRTGGDLVVRGTRVPDPGGATNADGTAKLIDGFRVDFFVQRGSDRTGRVVFRQGIDAEVVPKKHSVRDVKSRVVVEGQGEGINAVAVEVTDADLVAKYGLKEGFLDRKDVPHAFDLHKEGRTALAQLDLQATKITVQLKVPDPRDPRPQGYFPWRDYDLGDSVSLAIPRLNLFGKYRVMAITATPDQGGGLNHVQVDLDATAYNAFAQIAKAQISTSQSLSVQQRYPQGNVSLYQVNDAENLDPDRPFEFRFYVPSQPLFTNQIRLAWQGRAFRTEVKVGTTTVATQPNPDQTLTTAVPPGTVTALTPTNLPRGTTEPAGGNPDPVNPIGNHTHGYAELGHTHAVSPHQHPLALPGHTHQVTVPTIVYGIYEGDMPSKVTIAVNGNPLDPAAYGFGDQGGDDMEIGHYITKGWNTIRFTSATVGRIAAQCMVQAYLESGITAI